MIYNTKTEDFPTCNFLSLDSSYPYPELELLSKPLKAMNIYGYKTWRGQGEDLIFESVHTFLDFERTIIFRSILETLHILLLGIFFKRN